MLLNTMLLIQMTGLSGAGKSSIANIAKETLTGLGYKVELLDGDDYRSHLCHDLGFSKADRLENIHRIGFVGLMLAKHGVISILAAINPYEEAREALRNKSPLTKQYLLTARYLLPYNVILKVCTGKRSYLLNIPTMLYISRVSVILMKCRCGRTW